MLGGLLPRPPCGQRLARVGQFRDSLEDYVALGHAGRPESGLHEQAPRGGSIPERRLLTVWLVMT